MMSVNVITSVNTHILPGLVAYVKYSVIGIVAAITINGIRLFSDPPVVGKSGEDSSGHNHL